MKKAIVMTGAAMIAALGVQAQDSGELEKMRAELLSQKKQMEMFQRQFDLMSNEQKKTAEDLKKITLVRPSSSNIKDLQIRGRIQGQFGYTLVDNDDGSRDHSTLEMRRVRLGMRGTLHDDFRAQVEANMVPGAGFSMRSAFIEWRKHKPAYIKMGYDKPVFGFEENTSSAEILTVERTLINNSLITGPMTGLSLAGTQGMFSYNAGVYTDRDNTNAAGEDNDRYLVNLSAGLKLDDMMDGAKLRFRADYLHSDDPGGRLGGTFDKDAMAISGHYAINGFDLRAEYMIGRREDGNDISGWYIMPSQYLTDNLQVVARIEMAESDRANGLRAPSRYMRRAVDQLPAGAPDRDADQKGDKYKAGYVGLNYYMAENKHKLMLGLEMAEMENTPKGDLTAMTVYTGWRMLF